MHFIKNSIIILSICSLFGCINIEHKPATWNYHKGGDCKSLTGIYNNVNALQYEIISYYDHHDVRTLKYDSVSIKDDGKSLNFEFRINGLIKHSRLLTIDEVNCDEGYKSVQGDDTELFFYKGVNKSIITKINRSGIVAVLIIPAYFKSVTWQKLDWISGGD